MYETLRKLLEGSITKDDIPKVKELLDEIHVKSTALIGAVIPEGGSGNSWRPDVYENNSAQGGNCMSVEVIAAICGNLAQESHINPAIWESCRIGADWTDLKIGYGLCQWTNTGGNTHGRLYQLHEWLVKNNYAVDSAQAQLYYMLHEGVWYKSKTPGFNSMGDFLRSKSKDIPSLTKAFMLGFEGINGALDKRVSYAQQCYDFIIDAAAKHAVSSWTAKNSYLTMQQIKLNAFSAYNYLRGVDVSGIK